MSIMQRKDSSPFKKLVLSIGFIAVSAVYALSLRTSGSSPVVVTPPETSPSQSYKEASAALLQTLSQITGSTTPTPSVPTPTTSSPATPPAPVLIPVAPKPKGLYADGSYTGSVVDAYYGFVQVKAVIQNGKISDVQFLQYPNDRSNSRFINSQAMPLLKQEAIQAQNAQVSGVSGATFTSEAFVTSLSSALVLAKN